MDLKDIVLSEKKPQSSRIIWFHLYNILKAIKMIEMENRLVLVEV